MKKEFCLKCLKKSAEFRKIFKEGRKFLSSHFILYANDNGFSRPRIGISISKNHFKLATRRNRLRRVAKELFRKEIIPHSEGYDFVIASRATFPHSNIKEASKELKDLILKIKR